MKRFTILTALLLLAAMALGQGNVGIGTTTPAALLHTYGIGTGEGNVLFTGDLKVSSPGDPPAIGIGTRLMWYPDKAALRAGRLTSTGEFNWDKANIGLHSIAFGANTLASGNAAFATGTGSSATGSSSVAMGWNPVASGGTSFALGSVATASGNYSTAMGSNTTAYSGYETVIGRYNAVYTPQSITGWDNADRLFVIGNGTADGAGRSNALTVLKNGNVGIGVVDPTTRLDIDGQLRVRGGSPGAGKVLTSDADGVANWQPAAESHWTAAGDHIYRFTGNVGVGIDSPLALLHSKGVGTGMGNVLFEGSLKSTNPGAPPKSGAGTRMMWYPDKAAFRAGGVQGTQWDADSIGNYSFAAGYNTIAKGNQSVAIGNYNTASGYASIALGSVTSASGTAATSMGIQTKALGHYSTAMGSYTTAPSFAEVVIGRYNTTYTAASATNWNQADRLFVIGKGTGDGSRSNAVTVMKNGKVGIGTDSPTEVLDIDGQIRMRGGTTVSGHVLTSDADGVASWQPPSESHWTASGDNIYRTAGNVGIGTGSPAALLHTIGTGTGEGNVLFVGVYKDGAPGDPPASGEGTRMMWYADKAAIRAGRVAGLNWDKDSIGFHSTAFGYNTKAKGSFSVAMGASTTATGLASTALGSLTRATGRHATALGRNTTAPSYAELVTGQYNTEYTPAGTDAWVSTDRLFVIGNGEDSQSRSNAVTVLKSGHTGIGTDSPAAKLDVDGAIKLSDTDDAPLAGMVRWNNASNDFEGYDGDKWRSLTKANSGTWGVVAPTQVSENQKCIASDGDEYDYFGSSVSISGNYAIVGAPKHDPSGVTNQGAAYIFVREGNNWSQQAKLVASDGAADDEFGQSVAISGDYAIVGSPYCDIGSNGFQGAAYIYKREGANWSQQAKLTASDGGIEDIFGWSVSIDGEYAIAGAMLHSTVGIQWQGAAYIFYRTGDSWVQQAKLTGSDSGSLSHFGCSVSISGDHAIVGSEWEGAAYIYERSGMSWIEQEKFTLNPAVANFGKSVSVSGDYAIVGSPQSNELKGRAYLYYYDGTSWVLRKILSGSDLMDDAEFGYNVMISGDYVIVGAPYHDVMGYSGCGAAYIFIHESSGWIQQAKLIASDSFTNDVFGIVSISGDYAIVGASCSDPDGNVSQGEVYFFNR
jgi:hypothetical protein